MEAPKQFLVTIQKHFSRLTWEIFLNDDVIKVEMTQQTISERFWNIALVCFINPGFCKSLAGTQSELDWVRGRWQLEFKGGPSQDWHTHSLYTSEALEIQQSQTVGFSSKLSWFRNC